MTGASNNVKIVARNRRARHDYYIEDTYEAGLALQGTEVKSLRQGECSVTEAYAAPRGDELFIFDMHIPPYEAGNIQNHEPTRPRKLLLHRWQLDRIISRCTQRGYTLIPLCVYFKEGRAKVEIALAQRRKLWDKRRKTEERQRRRDAKRDLSR
ncbi:MAG: SsrA-binding protein SmpB [Planctomycetes bacterium]|nr:SsrA-binding protein SmpB [Planctomycetota bacterium]